MDSATFASQRGKRLDDHDVELQPIVAKALKHWSAKGDWYEDIVTASSVLWRELFEESAPGTDAADEDALMAQYQAELRQTLAKTQDPAAANASQAQTITYWVSTYTANNAEIRAQRFNGHPALKWVTRHDDAVRALHAAMDGKTTPSGKKFDLGNGVHMAHPGEPVGPLEYWINCRCLAQRVGKGQSMAGNATAFVEDALVAAPQPLETPDPGENSADLVDTPTPTPFHGVAAPTDTASGDGRQLAKAGFSTRNLPLPLNYQRGSYHGGDPGMAVTVGRIDAMWLDDATGLVHYSGEFVPAIPESGEAIQHVVDGTMRGVSVDVDNAEIQQEEFAGDTGGDSALTVFAGWRIAGVTMVAIPAFQEANIELGPHPAQAQEPDALVAAPGTHDGPGWLTNPVDTERLRRYWVRGEGRAKIAWGVGGDFDRCRAHLGKYVSPQYLAGTCANLHYEATGAWPGRAPGEQAIVAAGARMARSINLVAEVPDEPISAEFFANPELTEPTPFTVDEPSGYVYGHVATWGTCHVGYQGVCTTAPESFTNYAYFRTGAVATDAGDIPVGHITMDSGHAAASLAAKPAAAHYDNTAAVVADVAAGEDAFGIWVAGKLRPGLDVDKVRALKAAALSGDWRSIGGHLEMVAALAVNVPGFPIPRTSLAASGEHQESLTAAGIVKKENIVMATPPFPPKKKAPGDAPAPDSKPKDTTPDAPKAPEAPKSDAPKPPADKPAAPKAPEPHPAPVEQAPPTEKPLGPGDEAVNSAVETIHSALSSLQSAIPEGSDDAQKFTELMVTVNDLVKYLGLDKPEPKPDEPLTASAVAAMVRREVMIGARRDAAMAKLRAARVARAKRLVR